MDFLAFDFETANHNKGSVCALGIVIVKDNIIYDKKHFYINPLQQFDEFNIKIHKITPEMVKDAPTFDKLWNDIGELFITYPLVAHCAKSADLAMLNEACLSNNITPPIPIEVYDTMELAKSNLNLENNKLKTVSKFFNIDLSNHHDPLCDAIATAEIFINFLSSNKYGVYPIISNSGKTTNPKKRLIPVHGLIPPKENFVLFQSPEEKNAYLKNNDLPNSLKPCFYNGIYSEDYCRCEVVGYQQPNLSVIELDEHLHCITNEHLKDMQPSSKSKYYIDYLSSFPTYSNEYFYIKNRCEKIFENSAFREKVSVNLNLDKSVSFTFCGQKPFGFSLMKQYYSIIIKNDYFKSINLSILDIEFQVSNLKSAPDFTRILINQNINEFYKVVDYIFSFCEKYVDEHYVSENMFDCCHRYMECSDALRCTNPDIMHAKGCSYRNKLSNGIVFYGKNRNV